MLRVTSVTVVITIISVITNTHTNINCHTHTNTNMTTTTTTTTTTLLQDGDLANMGVVQRENFERLLGTGLATAEMVTLTMKEYHMRYDGFSDGGSVKRTAFLQVC